MSLRKNSFIVFCLLFFMTLCSLFPLDSFAATSTTIKLTAEAGKDGVTLDWNSITHSKGIKGYYVFRSISSGEYPDIPETDFWIEDETEYADTKVVPNTTYYYIVRPVLGDGTLGDSSNEKKVYYKGASEKITLHATVNTGNITLEWNSISDPKGVAGYYVYKSTKPGQQSSTPETDFWIRETVYVDKKVVPGTTYYYIVKPVFNDRTIGAASNEVTVLCQKIYGTISMTVGNRIMLVNGKYFEIDPGQNTVPVLKDGRTMLPIRALIEAMGGSAEYASGEKKITIKWNSKTINLWVGRKTITVDGVQKTIDVAPYISDTNRTMVPLRFVIENLGCNIEWDGNTLTATLSYLLDSDSYYPPTPPDETPPNVWTGLWFTDKGKMSLIQSGVYVNGTYGSGNNIEGVITGNKLIGNFTDHDGKYGFEFTISSDGQSFEGTSGYKNKHKKHWIEWDGKREADTLNKYLRKLSYPVDFNGTWSTDIGKLTITQNGNQASATYGDNGIIIGTVSNNKFTGTYQVGRNSGLIEIYMLEGNKNIIGHYGNGEIAKQDWSEFDGKKIN